MEQQEEQHQPRHPPAPAGAFGRLLSRLRANQLDSFSFIDTVEEQGENNARRWTMVQALDVSTALASSTSAVRKLDIELALCRPEAIGLFAEYIGVTQSLRSLKISYRPRFFRRTFYPPPGVLPRTEGEDSAELQQSYHRGFDRVLGAVLQNPAIEELKTTYLGSPETAFTLLSKTTLKKFELFSPDPYSCGGVDLDFATTLRAAHGFLQNSSLKQIKLHANEDSSANLGQIILALRHHKSLEDLAIRYEHPNALLYGALCNLLWPSASLKRLVVHENGFPESETEDCYDGNFDRVLVSLCRPVLDQSWGPGLKELHLVGVHIGLNGSSFQEASCSSRTNDVNSSIEKLTLERVYFQGAHGVKLLWPLIGLRVIKIDERRDEYGKPNTKQEFSSAWRELIERNPKLVKVHTREVSMAFLNGIWEGASSHETLRSLTHSIDEEWEASMMPHLVHLVEESKSLNHLCLKSSHLRKTELDQLVPAIANSGTLESFDLDTASAVTPWSAIIGSLIANKKLKFLRLGGSGDSVPYRGDFGNALMAAVSVNTTLCYLRLPPMVFREVDIQELLRGLVGSSGLRTLDFSNCDVDMGGLMALGRGLECEQTVVGHVRLPCIPGEPDDALKTFIESLERMKRRFKVTFGNELTRELLEQLLEAVKENENKSLLVDFAGLSGRSDNTNSDVSAQLKFYLKLNRFGRCLLGSTPMPRSLWPSIFAPMTASLKDSDALFWFLREYFTSCSENQATEEAAVELRPNKRVRTTE